MSIRLYVLTLAVLGSIAGTASAQDGAEVVLYFGAGPADENGDGSTDDTPISIGALFMSDTRPTVIGFDIAGEGAMFDSTGGGDRVRQALSFNLLAGANLYRGRNVRADAMILVGARESVSDCPDSFLGYQCYADAEPDTAYEFNYGAMLNATFDGYAVGVRATGESVQLAVGVQF